ncbi:hypothetical protein FACS1894102_2180 [Spirochaetia bacterium]|nr:hypothetical protein FACS1894102_2180 [Spirochaetia bacterium]
MVVHSIVLIPHRDSLILFNKWKGDSYCKNYSCIPFPSVCALAITDAPVPIHCLKNISQLLRSKNEKIFGTCFESFCFFDNFNIEGVRLSLNIDEPLESNLYGLHECNVRQIFHKPVLCAGVKQQSLSLPTSSKWQFPAISFSSCAVANMAVRPVFNKQSFEWKIGRLCWLPSI